MYYECRSLSIEPPSTNNRSSHRFNGTIIFLLLRQVARECNCKSFRAFNFSLSLYYLSASGSICMNWLLLPLHNIVCVKSWSYFPILLFMTKRLAPCRSAPDSNTKHSNSMPREFSGLLGQQRAGTLRKEERNIKPRNGEKTRIKGWNSLSIA